MEEPCHVWEAHHVTFRTWLARGKLKHKMAATFGTPKAKRDLPPFNMTKAKPPQAYIMSRLGLAKPSPKRDSMTCPTISKDHGYKDQVTFGAWFLTKPKRDLRGIKTNKGTLDITLCHVWKVLPKREPSLSRLAFSFA
ncbi:hypothetical protein PIB30_095981 [Stylosanthes scabra]|uniref:Uncharacterized protein n=1 Tax=Stylosanthes scabra TaxID=79078 RepID=A0ABU6XWX4_9FABA|nr:hypothetical protein [Stylosanthes scabra]